jgi:hypothetical protein
MENTLEIDGLVLRLIEIIGEGAFGKVIEVRDQFLIKYALKIVKLETSLPVNDLLKLPIKDRIEANTKFKEEQKR